MKLEDFEQYSSLIKLFIYTRKTGRYAPSFSRPCGRHARFASWGPAAPRGGLRPPGITGPSPMAVMSAGLRPAGGDDIQIQISWNFLKFLV